MLNRPRERLILALALLLVVGAFIVDVFWFTGVILPGPPFFLSILIAAYFLSPRATAGVAVFATALKLAADLIQGTPVWLLTLYFFALVLVGLAGTALARKSERETALADERKRLLKEIDESGRTFESVVENAPVGISLLRGPTFRYELVNPAYQAMVPGKTLLGRTVAEAWPDLADQVVPLLRQVLETGKSFSATDTLFPVQRTPGGPVEDVYFTFSCVLMGRSEAQADTILVLVSETTEQVRARQKIEELAAVAQRRAGELASSNKELEAFSYSVAHDLRSPVRHMEGFSKALLLEYADKLDERGKKYLQFVHDGSEKMGQLIDDLLMLTGVTRNELRYTDVDLSELAHSAAMSLQQQYPERQVDAVIAHCVVEKGDPRLLRLILDNLLSNAWKFTSRQDHARIEFGVMKQESKPVYYVRDNGVGFNMAYAHKLFRAFERLHGQDEFPGSGIGLATVERVVRRHGGKVWAEGEVNKGATFYFTLAEPTS